MKNITYILLIAMFIALSTSVNAQKELEGLVIYFSFDEGKGDTVKDLGPLKLEGKLVANPKWVDGKFGKALEFGGPNVGNYVEVAHQPELDAGAAVTVMSWIFPNIWTKAPSCCDMVWGFGVHGGCGGRVQWGLFQETDLKARFEADVRLDVAAKLPDPKKWTHVAITYEDGVGKVYLDGKLAAEGQGAGPLKKSNELLMIAVDCERLNYAFDGIIDEFRMFHQALSEGEINAHMGKGQDIITTVDAKEKLATAWGQVKQIEY